MASAAGAHQKLAVIAEQTATNGSNKTLGQLAELLVDGQQDLRNSLKSLDARVTKHHRDPRTHTDQAAGDREDI